MTIQIAESVHVSSLVNIEDSVRGTSIVVVNHSFIDSFVKIKPVDVGGNLIIGDHVFINLGCVQYMGNGIHIGNNVAIATNCTFAPVNHAYKDKLQLIRKQGFLPIKLGIVFEDDVWIGANCELPDGIIPGRVCMLDAGSVVQEELVYYTFYAGQPLCIFGGLK